MKKEIYLCDLCGEEVDLKNNNVYHIKIRSTSYITYANYDCWGADKKIIDICQNCVNDIKEYIKEKHEKK